MDRLVVWVKIANLTMRRLRILSNRVSEKEAGARDRTRGLNVRIS